MQKKVEYALYKGEDIIAIGTKKEIAEQLGIKEDTVRFYGTPTWKKRNKGSNHKILIKLEGD